MKCRGGAELPHPHPPTLGGFIRRIIPCSRMEEEEEEEALLLPINSLPFSPRCHSLFFFFSMSPMAAPRPAHAAAARACPRRGLSPSWAAKPLRPDPPRALLSSGEGGTGPPTPPPAPPARQRRDSALRERPPRCVRPGGELRLNGTRRSRRKMIKENSFIPSNEEYPAGSERAGGRGLRLPPPPAPRALSPHGAARGPRAPPPRRPRSRGDAVPARGCHRGPVPAGCY